MRNLFKYLFLGSVACSDGPRTAAVQAQTPPPQDLYSLTAVDINGKPFDLGRLKGTKVMVVNTASGFAPRSLRIPLPPNRVPTLKSSRKEEIRFCSRFASCCSWQC